MSEIEISRIINPLILNDGWVGFHGDSEFVDALGELHMGSWTFVDILEGDQADEIEKKHGGLSVEDTIPVSVIYMNNTYIPVYNKKGQLCVVQLHYRSD